MMNDYNFYPYMVPQDFQTVEYFPQEQIEPMEDNRFLGLGFGFPGVGFGLGFPFGGWYGRPGFGRPWYGRPWFGRPWYGRPWGRPWGRPGFRY